ncbi:MAG: dehydrogenase, partial [Flammeovirgaceae bacterium]|nr:dehydrogenase [Flammeovirgaceae bacterium]
KIDIIKKAVGRDYFHNVGDQYWQLDSASVLKARGDYVSWQTVYNMLDDKGKTLMVETQKWSMHIVDGKYIIDQEWLGDAVEEVVINEFGYGGMFLRMPWQEGMPAEVMNASRQKNQAAEGEKSIWLDVGMQVKGREDKVHIAILDHPNNAGSPTAWRVDHQFGVGPSRAINGDWQISKGTTELIQYRMIVFTGTLNGIKLTELWVEWGGNSYPYATQLWDMAREEAYKEKFLNPKEAVDEMTLNEDFKVNVFASEPMITQPMAFCWDDQGRMWIAENRDYESRGHGFSNSGDSRILILEDVDKDGFVDDVKVFLEGIAFPSAIAVGFDGLFLGAPPNLLFVPDADGDDKADKDEIEILLTGWGIRDRHETINSLHWGPDGWLYGLEGFATPSKIRKPNKETKLYGHRESFPEGLLEEEGVDINGGVWKYHPIKKQFEVVAHGFSNPWGIDHNAMGQLFISACVIPHLFHVVPGGIYHRQGGQHFNPYVYEDIKTIVDHRHRSAHGGARIYQSDAFSNEHNGKIFMANIHEHAILSDELHAVGSGYRASHNEDFLSANNAQWIGFSLEIGPEGGLYVLDWHDADICGQEIMHKETGRVFRITPKQSLAKDWEGRYDDLRKLSDLELVNLQRSQSDWHARRARVILQGRSSSQAISQEAQDRLNVIFTMSEQLNHRLRALWTQAIVGVATEKVLISALKDDDEYVRAWAIQFLCEEPPSRGVIGRLIEMGDDPSPVVRLYLAAAMQRIDPNQRWDLAAGLITNQKDNQDHNIPKMIWFAIEPLVAAQPKKALELAYQTNIELISNHIARRLVDAGLLEILFDGLTKTGSARRSLLQGTYDGLEGQTNMSAPKNWEPLYASLQNDPELSEMALNISQKFGDLEANQFFLKQLEQDNVSDLQRIAAIKKLAANQEPLLAQKIPQLLKVPVLRIAAIQAIASFNEDIGRHLVELILAGYPSYDALERQETIQTLAARSYSGWMLAEAIKSEEIPKRDIPPYTARQLRRVVGSGFLEIWGPLQKENSENLRAIEHYKEWLTTERMAQGNLLKGKQWFHNLCASCHNLYGNGGNIGPELTGSNRTDVAYLLSNIMDPSGVVQDDYKLITLTTTDGRTYLGNVINENMRNLTLRVIGQEPVVISQSSIQSRDVSELSMMPEGLLDQLSENEVIDLFSYLMTAEDVN